MVLWPATLPTATVFCERCGNRVNPGTEFFFSSLDLDTRQAFCSVACGQRAAYSTPYPMPAGEGSE